MTYLEKQDLIDYMQERFIDESSQENETIIDKLELKQIEIVKSYIGSRCDIEKLFDTDAPVRNEVIVSILTRLLLYWLIKRNAARKVPLDLKEDYDAAMKDLTDISTGKLRIVGLPPITDVTGTPVKSNSLYGNNKNGDFYI